LLIAVDGFMLRFGNFIFQPTLIPSLVTLLFTALLLSLGFWQLDRAKQKDVLQQRFQTHLTAPYADVSDVPLNDTMSRYRKVTAQGRYDAEHQILLDNQIFQGKPGYHVFTPLRRVGETKAILINRGWVPLGISRQQLPAIGVNEANRVVKGWVSQPANPGLRLDGPAPSSDIAWPRVVQYVDYDQLAQQLGYPLEPAVILLDPSMEGGYHRAWRPTFGGLGSARHRGYAVQWFSLAVALGVIYGVVNTRRCGTNH
jgi:surfeit locus 1 family protein